MGEFSASDCSWNKLVISKTDDQWTSTIKSERNDAEYAGGTASSDYGDDDSRDGDRRDCDSSGFNFSETSVHFMTQEVDPLLVHAKQQRRRRGSGPKGETPEERAVRLAKMSAYAAQRLANETPEQRAVRLKRMSEYAAKRLAQETSEQRAKRLARMSAYAAKRLSSETPEQRQARLARMSAYAAKRQALKRKTASNLTETQTVIADQS